MSNLIVKEVNFNGDDLIAVKDESTEKIYTSASYICRGIGFSKGQKDRQVENIQSDLVLKKGCRKFEAGVLDPNNEVIAIELDYLPLWLAKISITPKMQEENPELVDNLIEYQIKAKNILAEAFIKRPKDNMYIVNLIHKEVGELISATTEIENRVAKLEEEDFIKPFQKKALINARTRRVLGICGGKLSQAYRNKSFRGRVYQDIFRNIKNIYSVNEYDAIPKCKFNEALKLVNEYALPLELKYELQQINSQVSMDEEVV